MPSTNEQTPLLQSDNDDNSTSQDVYARFSFRKKKAIVLIVSFSGLLTFFAGGAFNPTIAVVAKDLRASQEEVNWTVAAYLFALGIGGLLWGVYSGYYGRKPIYVISLPLFTLSSLSISVSHSVRHLFISRFFQGLAASCFVSIGAATVSDVFRVEERGRAMGVYSSIMLLGTSLSPITGGFVSHYASWRVMQLILAAASSMTFLIALIYLPETIHPKAAGYQTSTEQRKNNILVDGKPWFGMGDKFVLLNPLKSLGMLLSPVLFISASVTGIALITDTYLLVPLSHVFREHYGIENEFVIGAVFIPSGVGNMVGALLSGYISDYVILSRTRSRGTWLPEDRLRASLPAIAVLVPLSIVGYGLTTTYVRGSLGIWCDVVWLFVNGVGVASTIWPANVYAVDIFFSRSAEVSAVVAALRQTFATPASGVELSLIKDYGLIMTSLGLAVICWFGTLMMMINLKYGERLRGWKDMGYTLRES